VGNSLLAGVGTALLIPPVYILVTMLFTDIASRARAFGAVSAMGGIGGATGPLIGGVITSAVSWRAAFAFQALVIVVIVLLGRRIVDPKPAQPDLPFDLQGAILSATGLVLLVTGIMLADKNGWAMLALIVIGALVLTWFFLSCRSKERAGKEPLLSLTLFKSRTSNLGMITQNAQWILLSGLGFVVAAYLQVFRGYDAIETGVIFSAVTFGLLGSSLAAERLARHSPQRRLIAAGFALAVVGIVVLLLMVPESKSGWGFAPGLLLVGVGLGTMLTPSVNVVQSSFPDTQQGEISGLSRSVSNLGSSLGVAIAGTVIVAGIAATPERSYALALVVLAALSVGGLVAALFLPRAVTAVGSTASGPGTTTA
jgi:MFS family permease